MNIIYFDLETQRTANDVGGWEKKGTWECPLESPTARV